LRKPFKDFRFYFDYKITFRLNTCSSSQKSCSWTGKVGEYHTRQPV